MLGIVTRTLELSVVVGSREWFFGACIGTIASLVELRQVNSGQQGHWSSTYFGSESWLLEHDR